MECLYSLLLELFSFGTFLESPQARNVKAGLVGVMVKNRTRLYLYLQVGIDSLLCFSYAESVTSVNRELL